MTDFQWNRLSNGALALLSATLIYFGLHYGLGMLDVFWTFMHHVVIELTSASLALLIYEILTVRYARRYLRSQCGQCGYYLYDAASSRCPECGTDVITRRPRRPFVYLLALLAFCVIVVGMGTLTDWLTISSHGKTQGRLIRFVAAALLIPFMCATLVFDCFAFQRRWSLKTYCQRCGASCIGVPRPVCSRCFESQQIENPSA